jgi:hypothetical protein
MRWIALLFASALPVFSAVDLRMEGERVWLKAHDAPLRDIMEAFGHAGVAVRFDPAIQARCDAALEGAPIESTLSDLLGHFSYVITWEVVRGPLGPITKLSDIQVYQPGRKDAALPLVARDRFGITTGPGGTKFVADEILIGFKPGTKMEHVRAALAQIGGTIAGSAPGVGVYQVRLPPGANVMSLVELLKRNERVALAEPNYVTQLPDGTMKAASTTPSARTVGAPANGAASVAVLDSGLLSGLGLDAGIAGRYDAVDPSRTLTDQAGHGTQMAMLVAGSVSPDGAKTTDSTVPVLAVRAFDEAGYTSNFALMRALEYASEGGAKVVNLSWGSPQDSSFVRSAVELAQSKGMVVVAAAGNEPTGQAVYPAAYPGVVSVAALNGDGTPWENSNYGSTVTLSAPGAAAFPVGYQGPPGSYSGTSIASAYVSRTLASWMSAHPTATADQAVQALKGSVTTTGNDPRYGVGKLDAAAVSRLLP